MNNVFASPAKLNLMLHIIGQREDGFHQLQTIFQLLDYGDTLHVEVHSRDEITLTGFPDSSLAAEDNLIVKAARLLQRHTGCTKGALIRIGKLIPSGGGLGGGSSNAATTLIALNRLWNTELSLTKLASLGLQLGADVPLFVHGNSAWAQGIGEQLTPIEMPPHWYLVITPDCSISTTEIFSHKQLTRNTSPIKIAAALETGGHNDCEPVVSMLYPEVKQAMEWLKQYAEARLTGTGASLFAHFETRQEAERVFELLPAHLVGFIARGVNVSPLHQMA